MEFVIPLSYSKCCSKFVNWFTTSMFIWQTILNSPVSLHRALIFPSFIIFHFQYPAPPPLPKTCSSVTSRIIQIISSHLVWCQILALQTSTCNLIVFNTLHHTMVYNVLNHKNLDHFDVFFKTLWSLFSCKFPKHTNNQDSTLCCFFCPHHLAFCY